jgi:multimeric flavodoxin WrbA
MALAALALNCTLKRSPERSNTEALLRKVLDVMESRGVECEMLRVADYTIKFGVSTDEGMGDQWPQIHQKIIRSNIIVIGTPIWLGKISSVCQMILERIDALLSEKNSVEQLPLYNKVAGCVVTGNEDGAQHASSSVLHDLMQIGATIPPNVNCYWVGEAGPGPSYIEAGQQSEYTNKLVQYTAHNLVHLAEMLSERPIPTQGNVF